MFKKIIIVSAILASSSSIAFADAAPYVGASLGMNVNNFKFNNAARDTQTRFNSSGLTGGLFAGYGATVQHNIYLGGEGFVNTGSLRSSSKVIDANGTTDRIKMTYSYGLDFVPGYKVTDDTMVYAKAGVVRTRFTLNQTPVSGSTLASGTTSNSVTGGQLGLGAQTDLNKNIGLRGEFIHTAYNSFSAYGNKIKPRNNQFNIGLAYKFD